MLWSLKFSVKRLVQAPTFFGHAKFEVKHVSEFFHLQSALGGSVHQLIFWSCLISGQKVFRNFFLYWALFTLNFFFWDVWARTFFGHAKFEVKTISAFFPLLSTVDSEFVRGWAPGANFFWSFQIWVKQLFRNFSFTECSGLWKFLGGWGSGHKLKQLFRNFSFIECSGLWICQGMGVRAPLFFVHTKFEVKKFFRIFSFTEHSGLWIFFWEGRGVQAPTSFGHAKFETKNFSEFFCLPSNLDSEFVGVWGRGSIHKLILVTPNLRSKCFQHILLYQVLWTLNLFGGVGGLGTGHQLCQIWD